MLGCRLPPELKSLPHAPFPGRGNAHAADGQKSRSQGQFYQWHVHRDYAHSQSLRQTHCQNVEDDVVGESRYPQICYILRLTHELENQAKLRFQKSGYTLQAGGDHPYGKEECRKFHRATAPVPLEAETRLKNGRCRL